MKLLLFFFLLPFSIFAQSTLLFVGTYTEGKPDTGIFVYEFNTKTGTGTAKQVSTGKDLVNPSFLTLSPNGKLLYACTDSKLPQHGNVAAFKIDSTNGNISFVNKQSSMGENPVYVSVNSLNNIVINANYTEGNISVYKTNVDGSLNITCQSIQFTDSSIVKNRQEKSHIHAAVFSPDNKFVFFTDLGSDKIRVFEFNPNDKKPLTEKKEWNVNTVPGSGPRHLTFHPNGMFAYCVEELSGKISAYSYKNGKLDSIQRINSYETIRDAYSGADIHISPDGLFLYASNRGENTISIFSINLNTGKLKRIANQSTFGEHPRNFVIEPSGKFLLVANAGSDNIIVFKRDLNTGLLTKVKEEISVPRPSCLKIQEYGKDK